MLQKIFISLFQSFLKNAQQHNGGSVSAIKGLCFQAEESFVFTNNNQ